MRSLSLLALVAAVLAGGSIRHVPTEAAADPVPLALSNKVQSIAIDARGLATSSLRAALVTHEGDVLDATRLADDRDALAAALVADGYLDAQVTDAKVTQTPSGAYVVFGIEQGSKFHVGAVTVRGATEKDAGVVALVEGDLATADRIELARQSLVERLAARGAKTDGVVAVLREDAAAATVNIELIAH